VTPSFTHSSSVFSCGNLLIHWIHYTSLQSGHHLAFYAQNLNWNICWCFLWGEKWCLQVNVEKKVLIYIFVGIFCWHVGSWEKSLGFLFRIVVSECVWFIGCFLSSYYWMRCSGLLWPHDGVRVTSRSETKRADVEQVSRSRPLID